MHAFQSRKQAQLDAIQNQVHPLWKESTTNKASRTSGRSVPNWLDFDGLEREGLDPDRPIPKPIGDVQISPTLFHAFGIRPKGWAWQNTLWKSKMGSRSASSFMICNVNHATLTLSDEPFLFHTIIPEVLVTPPASDRPDKT